MPTYSTKLTVEERRRRGREYARVHREKHRHDVNRDKRTHAVKVRQAALAFLGNKCNSQDCRWINPDGSIGCTDPDVLQIDHVNDDGAIERKQSGGNDKIYRNVLADTEGRYQILCANCNWKKRRLKEHSG